jgi:hypothetical protein
MAESRLGISGRLPNRGVFSSVRARRTWFFLVLRHGLADRCIPRMEFLRSLADLILILSVPYAFPLLGILQPKQR